MELRPRCFGTEAVVLEYKMYKIVDNGEWWRLYEYPSYLYTLWTMLDMDCQIEDVIYDFWITCKSKDCSPGMIFQNEVKSVFQITGIINAAIEIFTLTRDEGQSVYDFYFE